jgi:pyruvate,orthophosphate dikinase
MTFGYSRDDANSFLPDYLKKEILERDPFQSIDTGGVGQLMAMAVQKGRSTRPDLKCGICGEHGGDPKSVEFCHSIKLNYVSCSPFRCRLRGGGAHRKAVRQRATRRAGRAKAPCL